MKVENLGDMKSLSPEKDTLYIFCYKIVWEIKGAKPRQKNLVI